MSDAPLDTPTPPKHSNMTVTNFNYEGSYLLGLIYKKLDLSRSSNLSAEVTKIIWSSNFQIDVLSDISPGAVHLMVKNGNIISSSGQELQFHTATDI